MSVLLETSLGDIVIDLLTEERPRCSLNFLKLCKLKMYNYCLFHNIQRNFIIQTGDYDERGGGSVYKVLYGEQAKLFEREVVPKLKHTEKYTVSMVNDGNGYHGSQFLITTRDNIDVLDGVHTVFGKIVEGEDVITQINEAHVDEDFKPFQDIRIHHTCILHDPFDDPGSLPVPPRSPSPPPHVIDSDRLAVGEELNKLEGKTTEEIIEFMEDKELKANTQMLEIIGDIPDADVKPPENVLFVCKLNPVTTSDDLEIIFSRFGTIASCEVIRDWKTSDSLCYAFIEFEEVRDCEKAYFKMDNVLIDERRIHVDFSQSVSKLYWNRNSKQQLKYTDNMKNDGNRNNKNNFKGHDNRSKSGFESENYRDNDNKHSTSDRRYQSNRQNDDYYYSDYRKSREDPRKRSSHNSREDRHKHSRNDKQDRNDTSYSNRQTYDRGCDKSVRMDKYQRSDRDERKRSIRDNQSSSLQKPKHEVYMRHQDTDENTRDVRKNKYEDKLHETKTSVRPEKEKCKGVKEVKRHKHKEKERHTHREQERHKEKEKKRHKAKETYTENKRHKEKEMYKEKERTESSKNTRHEQTSSSSGSEEDIPKSDKKKRFTSRQADRKRKLKRPSSDDEEISEKLKNMKALELKNSINNLENRIKKIRQISDSDSSTNSESEVEVKKSKKKSIKYLPVSKKSNRTSKKKKRKRSTSPST